MGLALPILATAAAWPISGGARVVAACLIGVYCGATKGDGAAMVRLAGVPNTKIALFISSAFWLAWALATIL